MSVSIVREALRSFDLKRPIRGYEMEERFSAASKEVPSFPRCATPSKVTFVRARGLFGVTVCFGGCTTDFRILENTPSGWVGELMSSPETVSRLGLALNDTGSYGVYDTGIMLSHAERWIKELLF